MLGPRQLTLACACVAGRMRLGCVTVLVCALGWVAAQDAYTQGVVNGATLALAGTAVVGLGAIAIKQHQVRQGGNWEREVSK